MRRAGSFARAQRRQAVSLGNSFSALDGVRKKIGSHTTPLCNAQGLKVPVSIKLTGTKLKNQIR